MSRLERALIAAVAWYGACHGQLRGQDTVATALSITPTILAHLEQLADTATVEHGRCLVGYFPAPDTLLLHVVAETPWLTTAANRLSVTWKWWDCPTGTWATWHNHPWSIDDRPMLPPLALCQLSLGPDKDEGVLLHPKGPPIAVVSVRKRITCVFVRTAEGSFRQLRFDR